MADNRPYRPNVGICLFNHERKVWAGRCISSGPEIVTPGYDWQMPQGGIGENEDIVDAARRELLEETGVTSIQFLAKTDTWWCYDFPVGPTEPLHKLNPFRGQKQKWVAFLFKGQPGEISIAADHVHEPQEFFEWSWMPFEEMPKLVVPYKRQVYEKVVATLSRSIIDKISTDQKKPTQFVPNRS